MPDVLIFGDTLRCAELRHEVPVPIPDPFLYGERDGARHVLLHAAEALRLEGLPLRAHPFEEVGRDELVARGLPAFERSLEMCSRAARAWGIERAAVPASFPLELADRLRGEGVELTVDRELFTARRRAKTEAEIHGIRRAQRAAEAAMAAVCDLLRAADASGPVLRLDGAALTCERLKAAIVRAVEEHGALVGDTIVAHGPQTAVAHHLGEGPIAPHEPVLVDLSPRDGASACHADMTRTFVVGRPPPELVEWHRLCLETLEEAVATARAGVGDSELFVAACERFRRAGQPTALDKEPGTPLLDGFFHPLGHGVGLEGHEPPTLEATPTHRLVAGEVLALEPGLYRQGFGGVRLEDLVLVTDGAAERLTDFPYDLAP